MGDERLRELYRRWQETQDPEDLRRWLGARVQAGELPASETPCPSCGCRVGIRAILDETAGESAKHRPRQGGLRSGVIQNGAWRRLRVDKKDLTAEEICAMCGTNWFPRAWLATTKLIDELERVRAEPQDHPAEDGDWSRDDVRDRMGWLLAGAMRDNLPSEWQAGIGAVRAGFAHKRLFVP